MKIIGMGLLAALAAAALGACGEGGGSTGAAATGAGTGATAAAAARPPLPPGVVEVEVTEKGFVPDRIKAKKGETLTMLITRKTDATCATEIIIKDPPINTKLPLNVPVEVKITPPKEGDILFACAMNMIGGYIEVR